MWNGYKPSEVRGALFTALVAIAGGFLAVFTRDAGYPGWGLAFAYICICAFLVMQHECRRIADREVAKLSPKKATGFSWTWTVWTPEDWQETVYAVDEEER